MTKNIYEGIKETIQITPESITQCQPCLYLPQNLADAINHHISHHGYRLLHVGSNAGLDKSGNMVSDIIALLGK